jgi:signal transduction histidine kinase/ketosteroid isomerase-like protein
MKLTKKKKEEVLEIYTIWLHSYLNGDVATYHQYLDDAYHFIGSTNNEEFLDRNATTNFFEATADQLAGKCQLKEEKKTVEAFGDLVFITHVFDAWFLNGSEWTYYSRFRFSSVMQEKKAGWRFIYQHFSTTDNKADAGETIGFDKVTLENQELREAIKRRTVELEAKNRALEIEGALERIRAQAVAMQQSTDLLDIVVIMRNEFTKLGHEAHYFWHMMWLPETYEKAMTSGDGSKIGFVMTLPRHMHGDIPLLADWEQSDEATVIYPMNTKAAIGYVDKMVNLGDFKNIDPQAPTHDDIRHIGGLTFIMARTTHGEIGYSLPGVIKNPPAEDLDILVQFAGAFDLAHRRFLDLQKAEKQAREVQIELALEKVRSRTMAMQNSEELEEVILEVLKKLQGLGISMEQRAAAIFTYEAGNKGYKQWVASPEYNSILSFDTPYFDNPVQNDIWNARQNGTDFYAKPYPVEVKNALFEYMFDLPALKNMPKAEKTKALKFKHYAISIAFQKHAALVVVDHSGIPLTEAENNILIRLSKVFNQTYTRFLDLQKAEAQAREAQIEMALEKVRSRTMAMQNSSELPEAANNLFLQVQQLGIPAWSAGYCIWEVDQKSATAFMSSEGVIQKPFILPSNGVGYDFYKPLKKGQDFHVDELGGTLIKEHYEFMRTLPIFGEVIDGVLEAGHPLPTFQIFHIVYFTHGYLMFITYEEVANDWDVFKRFGTVFEQTYTRFLDLKKAEAQAREAQIEAALEKVRSRSLAMHNPEELQEVVAVVAKKLKELGVIFDAGGVILCTYFPDNKDVIHWISVDDFSSSGRYFVPYFDNPIFNEAWDSKMKGDTYFSKAFPVEAKNDFFKQAFANSDYKQMPEDYKQFVLQADSHNLSAAWSKNSAILIPSLNGTVPSESDANILTRFAKVFEQAYIRFLDLQKAEAQAKEAQIEAALEKVRSRSMGMQKSTELLEVILVVSEQLQALGFRFSTASFLNNNLEDDYSFWVAPYGLPEPVRFSLPYKDIPMIRKLRNAQKKKLSFFTDVSSIKEHQQWFQHLLDYSKENTYTKEIIDYQMSKGLARSVSIHNNIMLAIANNKSQPYSESENKIIARFGQVFEQSYTRFLDLERAESQTREAQIEAALEKVRSRTMAMQKGEELEDVVVLLYKELIALGVTNFATCGYVEINEETNKQATWVTSPGGDSLGLFHLPLSGDVHFDARYAAWKNQQTVFHQTVAGQERRKHLEYAITTFNSKEAEEMVRNQFPDPTVFYCFNFSHGYLHLVCGSLLTKAEETLLARFTKVFEQTYARFLDLQTAEKNVYKNKVEVALERVRSRAMAMQEPEELKDVAHILRTEMGLLGIEELETSSIYILDKKVATAECWYAIKEGSKNKKLVADHISMDFNATWVGKQMLAFHESKDETTSIVMKGDNRKEWITYCMAQSKALKGVYSDAIPDRTYHLQKFSHGAIGAASAGDISAESWALLKRSASVFSLAYARFKDLTQARIDLKKLKAAKKRAEEALSELQQTQTQLIQSEKMASLGELTAGIAHEIQNPLNFVNNFSEVSKELLEEMLEELENGDMEEVKAIMADVVQNLEKINHHGKRADGIVKGMLQHSRSSSGKKEPTDINALADEYLRLAYHGLRAKDKSFNATLETDFDESIGTINVIPQDIGRVILNLITNAFYASNERKQTSKVEVFKPTVSVSTKKVKDTIQIAVKDNGNGIPKAILDKIFQPFFTTKPTGQGTGLGLSMSYDIVTKGHGGALTVISSEGKGSEFSITLPALS